MFVAPSFSSWQISAWLAVLFPPYYIMSPHALPFRGLLVVSLFVSLYSGGRRDQAVLRRERQGRVPLRSHSRVGNGCHVPPGRMSASFSLADLALQVV